MKTKKNTMQTAAILILWLGWSLALPYNLFGQYTVLGRTPQDVVLTNFFAQQNNAATIIRALNLYAGTNQFSAAVAPGSGTNGGGSSLPFLLLPTNGLSYPLSLTNDNGVLTLQVGTNGYNLGTSNPPPVLFNNGIYYPLFLTNDNGVLTIMISTNGY